MSKRVGITKYRLLDLAMAALESGDEDIGICRACGNEQSAVEPDAANYTCENCSAAQVFGAEQLLLILGA